MSQSQESPPNRPALAARAMDTSAENPWPVRHLSEQMARYIERMPQVWVEGQIVQLSRRPGTRMAFLTIRDSDVDMSLPASALNHILDRVTVPLAEGAHVVVRAKPTFWTKRGSLQLNVDDIRTVGVGDLLARIEELKKILAAEGLFAADRKVPLPFLPRVVGLICGRESKAEHDVVVNARARWPQIEFVIREVAVQGVDAVPQVSAAIAELDANIDVEVIVVARGGGAVEDLLPFSNETLIRAAAACRTPLVSAIGHETDTPLLDLVADYRASTPTDAAKRIVPDVAEERLRVSQAIKRTRQAISRRIDQEQQRLDAIRSRPVLAHPEHGIIERGRVVEKLRDDSRRMIAAVLEREAATIDGWVGQLRALSPLSTLQRGYAVVLDPSGQAVTAASRLNANDTVTLKFARGEAGARITSLNV